MCLHKQLSGSSRQAPRRGSSSGRSTDPGDLAQQGAYQFASGADVYLFLVGMMLLAAIARHAARFD
jgi:hypothetical protein